MITNGYSASSETGARSAVLYGSFEFSAGQAGWVEIGNAGTDGHVIVDAVQWLPVKR